MAEPPEFHISSESVPEGVRVRVAGELDLDSSERLRDAASEAIDAGASELTVDLRGLTFMDSSGLRTLVELDRRATRAGVTLRLVRPPPPAAKVLEMTGTDRRLPLVDGVDGPT
jgi:anti-sigma B factor antagonist